MVRSVISTCSRRFKKKFQGVSATVEIRRFDSMNPSTEDPNHISLRPTRILALTGMSSLEDKRRAFEAGVDG